MFAVLSVNLIHSLKCAICCFSNNEKLPYNALFKVEKKKVYFNYSQCCQDTTDKHCG